jgi:hypothetical protein
MKAFSESVDFRKTERQVGKFGELQQTDIKICAANLWEIYLIFDLSFAAMAI